MSPIMLEVQSVSAAYGQRLALRGLSLRLDAGSVLGLIGPNGAGKTTLIRAISGVVPIGSGRILAAGRDLALLRPAERARLVAVVPQAHNLPAAYTVWETVLLGRTPHLNWLGQILPKDEARTEWALRRAQALELADRPIGELSSGEQQRVLLARALAQAAPVLLLDEPTANLDLQYQVKLMELVCDLAHREGLAVLAALHDLNLMARYADRAALLVQGELCAEGTPAEVLDAEVLSRAYQLPVQVLPGPSGAPLVVPAATPSSHMT